MKRPKSKGEFNVLSQQWNSFSLQRSEMFMDIATNSITRAPAERNVSGNGTWGPIYVSLRWTEEKSFGGRAFYKHLAPNGANGNNVLLHFQAESAKDQKQEPSTAPFAC